MNKLQTRNMPTDAKYLANKELNDLLYGHLQSISHITTDENGNTIRFVYEKNINKSEIAEKLKLSRPTTNKYFKKLVTYGFLRETFVDFEGVKFKCYQLPENSTQFVPLKIETLSFLISTTNANVIKIYTYLKMRHNYKMNVLNEPFYEFTYMEISAVLGYSYQNKNNKYIQNILKALTLFGLIECKWNSIIGEKSMFKLIRTNDYVVKDSTLVNPDAHSFNERLPKTKEQKQYTF